MTECLYCKHVYVIKDSRGERHSICTCAESDDFLHPIDIVFGGCESGEREDE